MKISYIDAPETISVFYNGEQHIVRKDNSKYPDLLKALKNDDIIEVERFLNIKSRIEKSSKGELKIEDNTVYYEGQPVHNSLAEKLVALTKEGKPATYLVKFLKNLMLNPSQASIDELYDFIQHEGMALTEDGYFLGYKAVTKDYKDIHTNTIDNSVGAKPYMDRVGVDDDRRRTCSNGYHVGAFPYAKQYGGSCCRIMLVKVNPKDVVSVPLDYDGQKCRVREYEVISEIGDMLNKTGYSNKKVVSLKKSAVQSTNLSTSERIYNYLKGGAATIKQIQSALKTKGLSSSEIYYICTGDVRFKVINNPVIGKVEVELA